MTKKTRTATKVSHTARYEELRHILEDRRREIVSEVNSKMKDVRVEGAGGIMQPVEMGDISDATFEGLSRPALLDPYHPATLYLRSADPLQGCLEPQGLLQHRAGPALQ